MNKRTIIAICAFALLLGGASMSYAGNKYVTYKNEVKASQEAGSEAMLHGHHKGKKYDKQKHENEVGLQTTLPKANKKDTHGIKSHDR